MDCNTIFFRSEKPMHNISNEYMDKFSEQKIADDQEYTD